MIDLSISWGKYLPFIRMVVVLTITYIIIRILLKYIKKGLLKWAKTKKQKSNIKIFSKVLNYIIFILMVVVAIFSYAGSWTGLGITAGLFSAALGWALQKPITGIAGWIMVVTRRPFEIGDRVIIGDVKGDVEDITITHIYVREVGGLIPTEESSGRIIMVPNSLLFTKNITNYTLQNPSILYQTSFTITFESNLKKAKKIGKKAAENYLKKVKLKKEPYLRTFFKTRGIIVKVRYFVPSNKVVEAGSQITQEIHEKIMKAKDLKFAYPHREVLLNKD